jgi:hypothetical protein
MSELMVILAILVSAFNASAEYDTPVMFEVDYAINCQALESEPDAHDDCFSELLDRWDSRL